MESPEEDSAVAPVSFSERSVLKDNRLRKALRDGGLIEKKKWFYVKSTGKWWVSGGRWVPRFVEVRVEPSKGIEVLRIWKSDDCQGLTQDLNLTKLDSVQKNFLDEKGARQFPISQDASCHFNDDKDKEFRWGHIIFTLTDVDNTFSVDFACESTLHRDSWLDWFEDYLILRETEKMNAPMVIVSKNLELAPSLVDKYVEDVFLLNKSRGTSHEADPKTSIQPCSRLSLTEPPYDRVRWEVKSDDDNSPSDRDHPPDSAGSEKEKQQIQYKTIKGSHNGTLTCKGKVLWGLKKVDKVVINLDDVKLIVEKEWNSSLTIQYISNPSLKYILTAESVEHRDNWVRWIQYVKAEPKVEKDLREGIWREAVLSGDDCREQRCYIKRNESDGIRLAFRNFSRSIKWDTGTDEEGRRTYRNGNTGSWKLRVCSENGRVQQTSVGYDIYEEYFQTRADTVPLPRAPSKEVQSRKPGQTDEKERGVLWEVFKKKKDTLIYENLIVDYNESLTKRRCDACPWDLDSGIDSDEEEASNDDSSDSMEFPPSLHPHIHIDPPEEEAGMTLARAKKKYGKLWTSMTQEQKRRAIVGSGRISEAQAKTEFYALPYAVIKCAKEKIGLEKWKYMTKTQQYEACKEYEHLAEKKPSSGPSKVGKMFGFHNASERENNVETPDEYKKIVKKKHAKSVFMDVFRSGLLKDVVDAMPDDIENLPQGTPLRSQDTTNFIYGEDGNMMSPYSQAAIPMQSSRVESPSNDIAIPFNSTPVSTTTGLGSRSFPPLISSGASYSPSVLLMNSNKSSPAIPVGPNSPVSSTSLMTASNPAVSVSSLSKGNSIQDFVNSTSPTAVNDLPAANAFPSSPIAVAVPLNAEKMQAGGVRESQSQVFQLPFSKTGIRWGGTDTTVVVAFVQPGSIAEQLGVVSGMELLEVDGMVIRSKNDLVHARNHHKLHSGCMGYRLKNIDVADLLLATTPTGPKPIKTILPPQSLLNILGTPTTSVATSGLLSTPPLTKTYQSTTFADSFNSLAGPGSEYCTPLSPLGFSFPARNGSLGFGSGAHSDKSLFHSSNPAIAVPLSKSGKSGFGSTLADLNGKERENDLLFDPIPLKTTLDNLISTTPQQTSIINNPNVSTFGRDALGSSADDLLSSVDDIPADPVTAATVGGDNQNIKQSVLGIPSQLSTSLSVPETKSLQMCVDDLLIDNTESSRGRPSHSETPSNDIDDLLGTPSEYPACWSYLKQSGVKHKKRWCRATSHEIVVFKESNYEIEEVFRLDMRTHSLKKDGEMSILVDGLFNSWHFELQSSAACSEWLDWYKTVDPLQSVPDVVSNSSPLSVSNMKSQIQLPLSSRRGPGLAQPPLLQPEMYLQKRGAAP